MLFPALVCDHSALKNKWGAYYKIAMLFLFFAKVIFSSGTVYTVQSSAKFDAPGLVNFVPAVAYHLCLKLHVAVSQPGAST